MKKKALISILSHQVNDEKDAIEVVTPGEFVVQDDFFEAVYDETEISGMEGTTTKIKISKDDMILEREGATATKMHFKKNNSSVSLYNTPYGMIELKINTKDLKINMNENGGQVFINYNLSIEGQKPQNTRLKIDIKA